MASLFLSLELNSLRLVEFLINEGNASIQREKKHFFSKRATHRLTFTQELKEVLWNIKKSWDLSEGPLHLILSADFALLRTTSWPSSFVRTVTLIQHDAELSLPLPLEKVCVAYQKMRPRKNDRSRSVAYAAMRTDFLESITKAIYDAGFTVQKMSLRPLSLASLISQKIPGEILLIDVAEKIISCCWLSSGKTRDSICFCPTGDFKSSFCDQETGLPLLLIIHLKKCMRSLLLAQEFPDACWITQTHSCDEKSISLSRFLQKEFSLTSTTIDPCLLLKAHSKEPLIKKIFHTVPFFAHLQKKVPQFEKKLSWKHFLGIKPRHITSINRFKAPSVAQFQNQQRMLLLTYGLGFLLILFSPLSLLDDYVETKKISNETLQASCLLKERQLELKQLRQHIKLLTSANELEQKELQVAHAQWPLLISELQKCAPPRVIWITKLTPISRESKAFSEIIRLEINGLYLEGMNGEALVHEYANKLSNSPLFLRTKNEGSIVSCSQEDGTAYAYPFSFQFSLSSPIQQ